MNEGSSEDINQESDIEKEKTPLSPEEKSEWLDGMEDYGQQLEAAIVDLKAELEGIEDENERQQAEVDIYDLEQQVEGMKEFVEIGRNPDEDLYREE